MKTMVLAALAVLGASVQGFDKPESAYWDKDSKSWYVSNVAVGGPTDKDGQGWISRLDASGKVLEAKWVEGLNAPKGIRTAKGKLYVTDIDELAIIDMKARKIEKRVKCEGAKFLNDPAVDAGGTAYASDMLGNAIYAVKDGKCEVFLQGESLENPNGLLLEGNTLVIGSWGPGIDPATFATKEPGRILLLDLKTKEVKPFASGARVGNLDGIEKDGDGYLVTDWMASKLFRVAKDGTATLLQEGFKNSADLGFDPATRKALVPEMGGGVVTFVEIKK
ncbi:MAG: hypothetical protein AB1405_11470 [Bdellovibrionota bacterium]